MVNNNAIINIISKITEKISPLGKKTLQKIVYLIEAKDVNLGCDYSIHFYGPYSDDLDFAVRELNDEGILQINYNSTEHFISVVDGDPVDLVSYNNTTIDEIINEFAESGSNELELLATALYVYLQDDKDIAKVKSGIVKIKGNMYSDKMIDAAIDRLTKTGYFIE